MILLAALLGAMFNITRGGAIPSFLYGKALNILAFGLFSLYFVTYWWQAPLCALAMWAGQAPSWGEIVGEEGILGGNRKAHWKALLRGGWWGGLIALATLSVYPLIAGLLLGLYFEVGRYLEKTYKTSGWVLGEALLGALLWGACLV